MAKARPRAKFTTDEREEVLLKVARLDARGRTTRDIATEIGVSPQQVNSYLKRLRRTELELAVDEVKKRRVRLLRELDEIKREAWEAWEKSKVRWELDADGNLQEVPANPNPAYLATVRLAMEDERTMLGLDEPPAKESGDEDKGVDMAELVRIVGANLDPADDVEAELLALNVVASNEPEPKDSHGDAYVAGSNGEHRNGKQR